MCLYVAVLWMASDSNGLQHWEAMKRIDELIIIIPVVLNLKGNLEMNLSSRLGTAVRRVISITSSLFIV